MSQTKFVAEAFFPHTSLARSSDFIADLRKVFDAHKATGFFITTCGPYPDGYRERNFDNDQHKQAGRDQARDQGRSERGRVAADDFAEAGGDGGRDGHEGGADEPAADAKPGRKPRSDAGKPRGKRGTEAGSGAAEGGQHGNDDRGTEGRSRATGRDGDGPAPEGRERRRSEGEDGERSGGRGVGRIGDAHRRDEQAAPVNSAAAEDWDAPGSAADDDWNAAEPDGEREAEDDGANGEKWCAQVPGDAWPDSLTPKNITRETISGLMSEHFAAAGGKQKAPTFSILRDVSNMDGLAAVPPEDFDRLARALLKDTARYVHGLKKPVTTAAKA